MKTILITTAAAMIAGTAISQTPASEPARDANRTPAASATETVTQKVRDFWVKSKGYLSENEATYKEGAQQALSDLNKEIGEVSAKAGANPPAYFQTRLQSLRQQHEHLSGRLNELNADTIKTRMSGPRYAFDKGVGALENALDQAGDEAETLAKVHSPDKRDPK